MLPKYTHILWAGRLLLNFYTGRPQARSEFDQEEVRFVTLSYTGRLRELMGRDLEPIYLIHSPYGRRDIIEIVPTDEEFQSTLLYREAESISSIPLRLAFQSSPMQEAMHIKPYYTAQSLMQTLKNFSNTCNNYTSLALISSISRFESLPFSCTSHSHKPL